MLLIIRTRRISKNGVSCLGFKRIWPLTQRPPQKSKLIYQIRDIYGKKMDAPSWLQVCSPNNYMRAIFYRLGFRRNWLRSV